MYAVLINDIQHSFKLFSMYFSFKLTIGLHKLHVDQCLMCGQMRTLLGPQL